MPRAIEQRLDAILADHGAPEGYPGHMDWKQLRADVLKLIRDAEQHAVMDEMGSCWERLQKLHTPNPRGNGMDELARNGGVMAAQKVVEALARREFLGTP